MGRGLLVLPHYSAEERRADRAFAARFVFISAYAGGSG